MNHSNRALAFCAAVFALFSVPACDNGGTGTGGNDDGSGGASSASVNPTSTSSTGMGNTTSTGNSMSTSTGSDVCYPTQENGFCADAPSCECHAMPQGMPPEAACPNTAGNVCTPGHNQCGCDLPMDTDYVMPDATCAGYVDGDIWQTEDGQYQDVAQSSPNDNGQLKVKFGSIFQPEEGYYNGFIMSDHQLSWNLANDMLTHCSGQFATDCKSITLQCWHGGETSPFVQATLDNLVHQ